MNFPPFDLFLDDMGSDYPARVFASVCERLYPDGSLPYDSALALMPFVSLQILRDYHAWLSGKIAPSPD